MDKARSPNLLHQIDLLKGCQVIVEISATLSSPIILDSHIESLINNFLDIIFETEAGVQPIIQRFFTHHNHLASLLQLLRLCCVVCRDVNTPVSLTNDQYLTIDRAVQDIVRAVYSVYSLRDNNSTLTHLMN